MRNNKELVEEADKIIDSHYHNRVINEDYDAEEIYIRRRLVNMKMDDLLK